MTKLREITGTFTLSDGREVHFRIHEDCGYNQWGSGDAGLTVDALNAMIDGLKEAEIEVGGADDEAEEPCDECGEEATQFWPNLAEPVQMCDACAHDALRSGWEPGR